MPSKTKRNTTDTGRKLKYDEMVTLSILALKDRTGSSSYAISKYMKENFPIASDTVLKVQLRNAIRRMEEDGRIIRIKASFKLTPEAKAQFLKKSGKSTSSTKKSESTSSTKKSESTSSTKKAEPRKKTSAKQTKAKRSAPTDKSKGKPKSTSTTRKAPSVKKATGSKTDVSKKTSGKKTKSESTTKK